MEHTQIGRRTAITHGPNRPFWPKRSFWAVWLLAFAVFLILYLTLFPFDFFAPEAVSLFEVIASFDRSLLSWYILDDFPRNVLLFVPFGLAIGFVSGKRTITTLLFATLLGLLLSFAIELIQAIFLLRFPALADLIANALGAAGGMVLYLIAGDGIARGITAVSARLTRPVLLLFTLVYLGSLWAASAYLRQAVQPSNWNPTLPLVIGNEQTGDRPWIGELTSFYVTDRALTAAEIAQFNNGGSVVAVAADSLIAHYQLTAGAPVADQTATSPTLQWQGGQLNTTAVLGNDNWLVSETAVSNWATAVGSSGEMTIGLELASHDLNQAGPARIISISNTPYQRNLMIGQAGQDLIIRLRTPFTGENGRHPEFVIPQALTDNETHRIIVSYGETAVRIAIDQQQYSLDISPAFTLFWALPHAQAEQFRLGSHGIFVYTWLYYTLYLIPLFIFIRLAIRMPRTKPILATERVS